MVLYTRWRPSRYRVASLGRDHREDLDIRITYACLLKFTKFELSMMLQKKDFEMHWFFVFILFKNQERLRRIEQKTNILNNGYQTNPKYETVY